jgi:hypothetical protein
MIGAWGAILLVASVLVGLVAIKIPHAALWIGAAMTNYLATHFYWRTGLPVPEVVGGMCDLALCIAIFLRARERWELIAYGLFASSVIVNGLAWASSIHMLFLIDGEVYSAILEAINWLLLVLILITASGQTLGASDGHPDTFRSRLGGVVLSLRRPSKAHIFGTTPN